MGPFQFKSFPKNLVQFRWLGGVLWWSSIENALKDLNPRIHALWFWANALLFEKCEGVFFQTDTRSCFDSV